MNPVRPDMQSRTTQGARADRVSQDVWRLEIPAGPPGQYRLAQLDDYTHTPRHAFPWRPPLRIRLQARASAANLPGTWGFGLWNDPFSFSLGIQGGGRRLPAMPNTAWYFFASPHNYLSFRDDLPAHGPLAATFRATGPPVPLLAPGVVFLPLLAWRPAARQLRRLASRLIHQDAAALPPPGQPFQAGPGEPPGSSTPWQTYQLTWTSNQVIFRVDNQTVMDTSVVPHGPLGLVLWVDNQFAAFRPDGQIRLGTLPNPETAWIELSGLDIRPA